MFWFAANIDREGYCPGELVLINSQVQNKTTRDMKAMKAKLIQTVTYTAEGNKKKHEVSVIAKLDGEFMRIDIYFQFPNCFFKLFD